jgi:hypothetical protein
MSVRENTGPLLISPTELVFPPPLNRVITNILQLTNQTEKPVAFKVKTTAPKRYCVRPNTGLIQPKETVEVQVLFNPSKEKPPSPSLKDKFQVQSIYLRPEDQTNADLKELWNNVPQDQILKQKLKCSFSTAKSSGVETGASESHMDFPDETPNPPSTTSSNLTTNDIPDMDMEQTSSDTKEVATEEDLKERLNVFKKERDEYSKQVRLLTERVAQLQKELEKQDLKKKNEAVDSTKGKTTPNLPLVEKKSFLDPRLLMYGIVALIFFVLGKMSC